jgi:hypothetical protein
MGQETMKMFVKASLEAAITSLENAQHIAAIKAVLFALDARAPTMYEQALGAIEATTHGPIDALRNMIAELELREPLEDLPKAVN